MQHLEDIRSNKDLHRLIKDLKGDRAKISDAIRRIVENKPDVVLRANCDTYLDVRTIRSAIEKLFLTDHPETYLQHIERIRNHFPDEELRARLIKVHTTHPWAFYINKKNIEDIFPNEYFRRILESGKDFFHDPDLLKIFLLYNADAPIVSFNEGTQKHLQAQMDSPEKLDVILEEPRDPGFACGGMEKNYTQAAKKGNGLCLVNDVLLAKFFHTKGEPQKVSYISKRTQETEQGYILWKEYIYAPADNQHEAVIDALEHDQTAIQIPHLLMRPVRPLIGVTSKEIFEEFEKNRPEGASA